MLPQISGFPSVISSRHSSLNSRISGEVLCKMVCRYYPQNFIWSNFFKLLLKFYALLHNVLSPSALKYGNRFLIASREVYQQNCHHPTLTSLIPIILLLRLISSQFTWLMYSSFFFPPSMSSSLQTSKNKSELLLIINRFQKNSVEVMRLDNSLQGLNSVL